MVCGVLWKKSGVKALMFFPTSESLGPRPEGHSYSQWCDCIHCLIEWQSRLRSESLMIPPTIGRVVLVYRGDKHVGIQWFTSQICFVHNEQTINVAGVDSWGEPFAERNLTLRQDDVAKSPVYLPEGLGREPFACWMPYQRTRAAR